MRSIVAVFALLSSLMVANSAIASSFYMWQICQAYTVGSSSCFFTGPLFRTEQACYQSSPFDLKAYELGDRCYQVPVE
jgi:hypothetical protein